MTTSSGQLGSLEHLQLLALAKKQLDAMERAEAFDPYDVNSRPTAEQLRVLKEQATKTFQVVSGGNQCLAAGTLVMTPIGDVPIESIRPGDIVYNEYGEEIKVLEVFNNGPKEVVELKNNNVVLAECTDDHVWLVNDLKNPTWASRCEAVKDFCCRGIRRVEVNTPIGTINESQSDWVGVILGNRRVCNTYDIHVDSLTNLYLLANGLVTHNSGKSAIARRTTAWFFNRDHPYLNIDAKWPNDPMTILFLVRSTRHADEHWDKIEPFLVPGSYKPEKSGNTISTIRRLDGMAKIMFISYENPRQATERIASMTAHLVIVDEICNYWKLYEEVNKRVQKNDGLQIHPFTAKIPAPKVKKFLYTKESWKGFYTLNAFDNPAYTQEKKEKILAGYAGLPPDIRQKYIEACIEGTRWLEDSEYVYGGSYDPDVHLQVPQGYSLNWRHVEAVDPAASGLVGYTLFAEDPNTGYWYIIKGKYLKGEAASVLLDNVLSETGNVNLYVRTCDSHETWYIKEARARKVNYRSPSKKGRKHELIKGVSERFISRTLYICPGSETEDIQNEVEGAMWSETRPDSIKSSTDYHCLDATQYGVDVLPEREVVPEMLTDHQLLKLSHERRKAKIAAKEKRMRTKLTRLTGSRNIWRR